MSSGTLERQVKSVPLAERMALMFSSPALLLLPERLLLYSLVFALKPRRTLEIGTRFGGSAVIISAALDDLGAAADTARIVCLDPNPEIAADVWTSIEHRATLIRGFSPDALAGAAELVGGAFDFIFIDGDHGRAGVLRDIEGVLTVAAPNASIVCHDANHFEVEAGIQEAVSRHPDALIDCGLVSTHATEPKARPDGAVDIWGGFRLLRTAAGANAVAASDRPSGI
jgi:predicted O-methyltransferase YrrM